MCSASLNYYTYKNDIDPNNFNFAKNSAVIISKVMLNEWNQAPLYSRKFQERPDIPVFVVVEKMKSF